MKVLLLDEDAGSRLLTEALEEMEEQRFAMPWLRSLSFVRCETLAEARAALDYDQFDAILLNTALPENQGLQSFLRLREEAPELPVVVIAEREEEALSLSLVRQGAQDVLARTQLDCVPLARALRVAVERHRLVTSDRSLSFFDTLTGLYNHAGFASLAEHDLRIASRMRVRLMVMLVELDGLDDVVRDYGRQERDLVLIELAELLREVFPASDIIGRLGPRRFGVLFTDPHQNDERRLEQTLQRRARGVFASRNARAAVSLRVGFAVVPAAPVSIENLWSEAQSRLENADRTALVMEDCAR